MAIKYKYNNQEYYSLKQLRDAVYSIENKLYGNPKTQEEFTELGLEVEVIEFDPLDDLTVEQLKENCQVAMNAAFTEYRNSSKTYIDSSLGFPVNANEVAYQNIDGCLLQAQQGSVSLDGEGKVAFTDFNDNLQMLTAEQLTQLKLEVSENGSRAYGVKWTYRQQIDSMSDKEQLKELYKNGQWDFRPDSQKKSEEESSEEEE